MRLNLKSDLQRVVKYIQQRCKDYPVYVNAGPGHDEDAITLITLGYQYDQDGWVALVFDTRPDAEVDGSWQNYIAENAEPFQAWTKAWDAVGDGEKLELTGADGRTETLKSEEDLEALGERIGEMCRDALLQCKQKGYFKKLPLADHVRLAVEDHDGGYGWTEEKSGAPKQLRPKDVERAMIEAASKLTPWKRIEYWLAELERLAAGTPTDAKVVWDSEGFVLKQLLKIGKDAVVPLLTLANRWAGKTEFLRSKRQGNELQDAPHQHAMCAIFHALNAPKLATPEAEALVQRYIRTATRLKPIRSEATYGRKSKVIDLHGIVPWHAARLLHARFDGYPAPEIDEDTNQLLNASQFIGD